LINENGGEEAFLNKAGLTQNDIGRVKTEIEQQIRINQLVERLNNQVEKVSEQDARDYYSQNKEQFVSPEQVRAAHIVVHTDSKTSVDEAKIKILEAREKLKKGQSFEKLADAMSDCPGNGGDLGYFSRGKMVQEFEDVVFSMQRYQISDVFQTGYGFHIAKVYDRIPEGLVQFEQVKEKIIEHLIKEKQQKALETYLDKLREDAEIQEI
jgi:parvulin-like peptidyl-prolyl isomerase